MTSDSAKTVFIVGACALFLSGCAASSDKYPSLAIRDFEKTAESSEEASVRRASPLSDRLVSELQSARDVAMSGNAAFNSAVPGIRQKLAAARGEGPNSNAWSIAQIALADLSSQRSQTAIALGNIDAILAEASGNLVDIAPHRSIQSEVARILQQQDRTLAQLGRGL